MRKSNYLVHENAGKDLSSYSLLLHFHTPRLDFHTVSVHFHTPQLRPIVFG